MIYHALAYYAAGGLNLASSNRIRPVWVRIGEIRVDEIRRAVPVEERADLTQVHADLMAQHAPESGSENAVDRSLCVVALRALAADHPVNGFFFTMYAKFDRIFLLCAAQLAQPNGPWTPASRPSPADFCALVTELAEDVSGDGSVSGGTGDEGAVLVTLIRNFALRGLDADGMLPHLRIATHPRLRALCSCDNGERLLALARDPARYAAAIEGVINEAVTPVRPDDVGPSLCLVPAYVSAEIDVLREREQDESDDDEADKCPSECGRVVCCPRRASERSRSVVARFRPTFATVEEHAEPPADT
jgi:hypothetical protein